MDLSQNTFYRMLHYRKSYKPGLSFRSWIFGIARNIFFDSTKSKHSKTDSLDQITKEQQFEKRFVTTGLSDGINIEITDGLDIEEKVKGEKIDPNQLAANQKFYFRCREFNFPLFGLLNGIEKPIPSAVTIQAGEIFKLIY